LVVGIISAVLAVIAGGAYAPVVREALAGQRLTIGEALGRAYNRFWSLLGAGILVVIIVVPGIIFATWYAYTTPAIMLEKKGAATGMAASKAFGRDKKWSTFSIFLIFLLAYILVSIFGMVLSVGGGGRVIQTLLTIPLEAWTSVVIAYTYITHGPSASAPLGPQPAWQQPPLGSGASAEVQPSPGRFCPQCGSALKPDSKFCTNCGKPV
jgi:zinc-ribbon domain